jgi:hypothetical protein
MSFKSRMNSSRFTTCLYITRENASRCRAESHDVDQIEKAGHKNPPFSIKLRFINHLFVGDCLNGAAFFCIENAILLILGYRVCYHLRNLVAELKHLRAGIDTESARSAEIRINTYFHYLLLYKCVR